MRKEKNIKQKDFHNCCILISFIFLLPLFFFFFLTEEYIRLEERISLFFHLLFTTVAFIFRSFFFFHFFFLFFQKKNFSLRFLFLRVLVQETREKKKRKIRDNCCVPSFLHPSPFLSFSPFETKPFETEDALETEEREPIEKPRKKGKRWGCAGGWKESEERKRRGERKRKEARRGEEDEGARNERERPRRAASGRRASRRRVKTERRRRSSQSASASRRDVLASWWLLRRFYPSFSYPSWASPMLGSTNHRILRVVAILRRFSWTAIVANKICSISNYRIISSLRGKLRHAFVQKKRGSIWVALRLPHSLPVYREKIYRSIECEIKSENYRALCDR